LVGTLFFQLNLSHQTAIYYCFVWGESIFH